MDITELLMSLSKDIGDIKANVAKVNESIENLPQLIELSILKHKDNCNNISRYVTKEEFPVLLETRSSKSITKWQTIISYFKDVVVIIVAVFTGKFI